MKNSRVVSDVRDPNVEAAPGIDPRAGALSATDRAVCADDIGARMYSMIEEMYPICRSITGDGVRETLAMVGSRIPLEIHEVPTGTPAFDWQVPKEWNVRDAYIKNARGERVVDFRTSNLHLVNYSVPIRATMALDELKPHLFSLPEHPDWIPYRTSYYSETWGFCLTHNQLLALPDGQYEVVVDTTLDDGFLTYGEYLIPGETDEEILISTHVCHPSLCNDNLSGIATATYLAKHLSALRHHHSYRFIFSAGAIGSIAWLSQNEDRLSCIRHGLVLALVGDRHKLTYKKSRYGDAEIDRVAVHALTQSGMSFDVLDFSPYGYGERQFCSPGINLPVGRLTRSPDSGYPEYHTSADNLDIVVPECLEESFRVSLDILTTLDRNMRFVGTNQKCEPQLGSRGLFNKSGGAQEIDLSKHALLWVLNLSDGAHTLLDIAERAGMPFSAIDRAARDLANVGLLTPAKHE